ncbi:MAG: hypothetical protein HY454_02255 [Parcubacteria group bacterium]|nr:hypothetical protein [Parcubacteria group bacterium]
MKTIYKVGIIGGGIMGADLAALMARQDMPVVVKELNNELAEKLKDQLNRRINGWLEKGKINESRAEQLKMLFTVTASYDDLREVDLVIEAVPENLELKMKVFRELEELLPEAILTSNTSSLPISSLSAGINQPERMAGMHFFNPPTKMPLVELIATERTSSETLESLELFAGETLSKKVIRVKDRPGFLINVLLGAYLAPAIRSLENWRVPLGEIDERARSFGWPMGPFVLLDLMGIDLAKEVMSVLFAAYGERFSPSSLVEVLVRAGRFGQKSGAGFYGGTEPLSSILEREFPNRIQGEAEAVFSRMMAAMINEAALALQNEIASANDIEIGCLFGLGFPQVKGGPLHYADEIGLANIVRELGDNACPFLREMADRGETFFSSW